MYIRFIDYGRVSFLSHAVPPRGLAEWRARDSSLARKLLIIGVSNSAYELKCLHAASFFDGWYWRQNVT
jgi:hypothetical protein